MIDDASELWIVLTLTFDLPHRVQDRGVISAPELLCDLRERAARELTCEIDGHLSGRRDRIAASSLQQVGDRDFVVRRRGIDDRLDDAMWPDRRPPTH